tara:strand:+ start:4211 stop:4558 length:348 start_codon:yes stop_codon:yes gene_type:complete
MVEIKRAPVNLPKKYPNFSIGVANKISLKLYLKSLKAALLKKAAANSKPNIVKVLVNTDIMWGAFLFTLPIDPPIVTLSDEVAAKLKIKTIRKNKYTMGCFKVYLSSDFRNDLNI